MVRAALSHRSHRAKDHRTSGIFRDSAFADDVAKTNMTAILQQRGPNNVRNL